MIACYECRKPVQNRLLVIVSETRKVDVAR